MLEYIKLGGIGVMFATCLMFLLGFWQAYFLSPDYCITCCFNYLGEAHIEFVLSIVVLVLAVFVVVYEVRNA